MADDINRDDEPPFGAARTVEAYHIEEAVRQAQLARSNLTARLAISDRGEVEEVRPVAPAGARTQAGTPVVTAEPDEEWEDEST